MEDIFKDCTAPTVDPRLGQQPHTINATDRSFANTRATQNQDAVTDPQTFAIIIIGRSDLFRDGLARLLSTRGFRVVGSASRVDELGQNSVRHDQPVLLILDAGDDMETAIKQLEFIKQQRPSARTAVLADSDQILDLVSSFRAGARAYFARETNFDAFLKSLELVMLGGALLPHGALTLILGREVQAIPVEPERNGAPRLSVQERLILRHLTEGCSNKVIGKAVEIAEGKVKVRVKAIFRKIGVTNRTQAAMWALHNPPPEWAKGNGSPAPPQAALP